MRIIKDDKGKEGEGERGTMLTRRDPLPHDIIQLRVPLLANILKILPPRRRAQNRERASDGFAEDAPVDGVFELVDHYTGLLIHQALTTPLHTCLWRSGRDLHIAPRPRHEQHRAHGNIRRRHRVGRGGEAVSVVDEVLYVWGIGTEEDVRICWGWGNQCGRGRSGRGLGI